MKKAVKPLQPAAGRRLQDRHRGGRKRKPQAVAVAPDDIAFLQYTGGTTGVAKGATLLHRNVAANVAAMRGLDAARSSASATTM